MAEREFHHYFAPDSDNPGNFRLIKQIQPTSITQAQPIFAEPSFTDSEAKALHHEFSLGTPSAFERAYHYISGYEHEFEAFWDSFRLIKEDR